MVRLLFNIWNNHQQERLLQRMLGNVFHGIWASAHLLLPSQSQTGGKSDEIWPGSNCSGQQISAMDSSWWQQWWERTDFCYLCFLLSWSPSFSPEITSGAGSGVWRCAEVMMGQEVSVSKRVFHPIFPSETSVNDCLQMRRSYPHWPRGWRDPRLGQDPSTDSENNPINFVSFWIEMYLLLTDFKIRSVVLLKFHDFTSLIPP